jgi:hypothetical protein
MRNNGKAFFLAVLMLLSVLLSACDEPKGKNGKSCIGQATTCLAEVVLK